MCILQEGKPGCRKASNLPKVTQLLSSKSRNKIIFKNKI